MISVRKYPTRIWNIEYGFKSLCNLTEEGFKGLTVTKAKNVL